MITLTDKAVQKIKQFADDENLGHYCVRVRVVGGGCAGLSHDMYFDDATTDMDEKIEQDGITLIVDCLSVSYMGEITIDYYDAVYGSGFKFIGNEELKTCGCGSSFSI